MPISVSAYSMGDELVYTFEQKTVKVINGTTTLEYDSSNYYIYKLLSYNDTTKINFVRVTFMTPATTVLTEYMDSYNISLNKIYLTYTLTDLNLNNYYDIYMINLYSVGPIVENSTMVLDYFNRSVSWLVGNKSLVSMVSAHYDVITKEFKGTIKFPIEQSTNIDLHSIRFSGQATLDFYIKIRSDNVIEHMDYHYKAVLLSPTNGNYTVEYSQNFGLGSAAGGGFSLSSLLGENSLVTIALVGVIGIVIGVAIGRKH